MYDDDIYVEDDDASPPHDTEFRDTDGDNQEGPRTLIPAEALTRTAMKGEVNYQIGE